MKEYKISCENAEVKSEAIKLFEVLGYHNYDTSGDEFLFLMTHKGGEIQGVTNDLGECLVEFKQITIEKLRKMAKPTECLVKTDNGWEYKTLPEALIGDAVKIPEKANFAVESKYLGRDTVALCKQACGGDYRFPSDAEWRTGGRSLAGQTLIWQRTEKSKFIVKTKLSYEVQELPKDTPVTWHCIPLVDSGAESDQIGFYELCDKVEVVDFRGAKWMRNNINKYGPETIACFVWRNTPQGHDYWRLIDDLIK